jgi:hypothetical protein
MRFTIRTAAATLVVTALCLAGTPVWGRLPPQAIPSYRPPRSMSTPATPSPKNSIIAPNNKGGKQKGWSPFGGRPRSTAGRIGMAK